MGQVSIYAPGWRVAQFVLTPCLRAALPQKVASDGFDPRPLDQQSTIFNHYATEARSFIPNGIKNMAEVLKPFVVDFRITLGYSELLCGVRVLNSRCET